MIRGTTPTLSFTLPFETELIKKLWVTFSQCNKEIFTLEKDDCELNEYEVEVKLSQRQTLQLLPNAIVEIQLRVLTLDDVALASDVLHTSVQRILKDGEI
jgi:hypothetical protein